MRARASLLLARCGLLLAALGMAAEGLHRLWHGIAAFLGVPCP